ncbi:MAG: thymidine kinase [Candidatus Diapherotrites archaeon]
MTGRLEVIVGPMFSGKSSELIRRINRVKVAQHNVQVFKFFDDQRFSASKLSSHDRFMISAIPVRNSAELKEKLLPETTVVGIDEAQFFDDKLVGLCEQLAGEGKTVICTTLNQSFRGEPFTFKDSSKNVGELVAVADDVDFLSAVCTFKENRIPCGARASKTQRLINGKPAPYDSPLVLIGEKEFYEARCRKHHFVPGKK